MGGIRMWHIDDCGLCHPLTLHGVNRGYGVGKFIDIRGNFGYTHGKKRHAMTRNLVAREICNGGELCNE